MLEGLSVFCSKPDDPDERDLLSGSPLLSSVSYAYKVNRVSAIVEVYTDYASYHNSRS